LKLPTLIFRICAAIPLSFVIAAVAWYLWLNEAFLAAKTDYDET